MSAYTPTYYSIMLAQMLKDPGVLQLACTAIEGVHIVNPLIGGTVPQSFAFVTIQDFYKRYKCSPDIAALRADLQVKVAQMSPFGGESPLSKEMTQWLGQFEEMLEVVDERSVALARSVVEEIHRVCVYQTAIDQTIEVAKASNDMDSLGLQLSALTAAHNAVKGGTEVQADVVFGANDTLMRVLTAIPFIDRNFGDGQGLSGPGAATILAPQGAGKTTLGVQIAVNQAMMGRYCLLVLAENGWQDRGIQLNTLAAATGVNTKHLESSKTFEEAVAKEGLNLEVCLARRAAMLKYVKILDLAQSGGDLSEVEAKLLQLKQQGITPAITYIDWAGAIAERMYAAPKNGRKFLNTREALSTIANEVTSMADRYHTFIFISHQMATAYASRGRFGHYDMYCAHENRMFTAHFKYVAVITATGTSMDKHGDIQVLEWVKARNDANKIRTLLVRKGPYCVFEEQTSVTIKNKKFIDATSAPKPSPNSIPTEHRRNASATE